MKVVDIINRAPAARNFSYEVLPPLKGNGTSSLFATIEKMQEMQPLFINITTHHSEYVFRETTDGQYERLRVRRRPGTIAMAATIQQRYKVPVVPHLICSGTTAENIEYELIDLQILGVDNLLILRGDKAADERHFHPTAGGYSHATELLQQVQRFNEGFFLDGTPIRCPGVPFHCGVAAYPEKHEEAPNLEMDLYWLKQKEMMGAEYAITQLFYDNTHYFRFVEQARKAGITLPIIPAIKPLTKRQQITMVPKTFHCDIPQQLASEVLQCHTDEDVKQLGVEWAVQQCRELYDSGVTNIHFFTMSAVDSVANIVRKLL